MDILKSITRITGKMDCDSICRKQIQGHLIYRYELGLSSDKCYLCELLSVQMTLCYLLGPSCLGGLDIIHISHTILTWGLYDILCFGIFTFWFITAEKSQCGCSYFVCVLFISLSITQWKTSNLMARTFSFKCNPKQPISMVKAHFVLTRLCFVSFLNELEDLESLNLSNL